MIRAPLALGEKVLVATGPSIDPCTGRCINNTMLTAPAGLAIGDRVLIAVLCEQ